MKHEFLNNKINNVLQNNATSWTIEKYIKQF